MAARREKRKDKDMKRRMRQNGRETERELPIEAKFACCERGFRKKRVTQRKYNMKQANEVGEDPKAGKRDIVSWPRVSGRAF